MRRADVNRESTADEGVAFERDWPSGTTHLAQEHENILSQGLSVVGTFLVSTASTTEMSRWNDDLDAPLRRGARSLFDMSLDQISREAVEQHKESDASHDGYDGRARHHRLFPPRDGGLFWPPENGLATTEGGGTYVWYLHDHSNDGVRCTI